MGADGADDLTLRMAPGDRDYKQSQALGSLQCSYFRKRLQGGQSKTRD